MDLDRFKDVGYLPAMDVHTWYTLGKCCDTLQARIDEAERVAASLYEQTRHAPLLEIGGRAFNRCHALTMLRDFSQIFEDLRNEIID